MVTFPPSFDFRSPVNPVNLDQWSHAFSDLVVTFFLSFNLRWVRFSLVCFHFVTYQIKSNVGLSQIERLMPSFRAGVFKGGCKIHLFFFKWSSPPPKDVTKVDDGYLGIIQLFFKTHFEGSGFGFFQYYWLTFGISGSPNFKVITFVLHSHQLDW